MMISVQNYAFLSFTRNLHSKNMHFVLKSQQNVRRVQKTFLENAELCTRKMIGIPSLWAFTEIIHTRRRKSKNSCIEDLHSSRQNEINQTKTRDELRYLA